MNKFTLKGPLFEGCDVKVDTNGEVGPNVFRCNWELEPEGTYSVATCPEGIPEAGKPKFVAKTVPLADGDRKDTGNENAALDPHERSVLSKIYDQMCASSSGISPVSWLCRPLECPPKWAHDTTRPFFLERYGVSLKSKGAAWVQRAADPDDLEFIRDLLLAVVCTARALAELQKFKSVHRDVTPNNILFEDSGAAAPRFAVLIDYSHSAVIDDASYTQEKDVPRQTLGTSFFQAPGLYATREGLNDGNKFVRASIETDLFALGVSIYAAVMDEKLPWKIVAESSHLEWTRSGSDWQHRKYFATALAAKPPTLIFDAQFAEFRSRIHDQDLIDFVELTVRSNMGTALGSLDSLDDAPRSGSPEIWTVVKRIEKRLWASKILIELSERPALGLRAPLVDSKADKEKFGVDYSDFLGGNPFRTHAKDSLRARIRSSKSIVDGSDRWIGKQPPSRLANSSRVAVKAVEREGRRSIGAAVSALTGSAGAVAASVMWLAAAACALLTLRLGYAGQFPLEGVFYLFALASLVLLMLGLSVSPEGSIGTLRAAWVVSWACWPLAVPLILWLIERLTDRWWYWWSWQFSDWSILQRMVAAFVIIALIVGTHPTLHKPSSMENNS